MDNLTIRRVPLDAIIPDPANPRLHDERNLEAIRASLSRFGQAEPIVTQAGTRRIIAGHGRLEAMKALGWTDAQIVELPLDDTQAAALGIAMNRTGELASWDDTALTTMLRTLEAQGALDATGFTADELDTLLKEIEAANAPAGVDDPGPTEPPEVPVTQRGDLWILGDHRLLCGDSTSAEDVARLMNNEVAGLWSSDPPYCVNYTGQDRPIHDGKPSGKDWSHVYREVDLADLGEFLDGVFTATLPHLAERSAIYCWHAHVQQPTIAATFERHGLLLHQVLVWVKPSAVFGHSYYRWRHEPCAFGWRQGSKPQHGVGQLDTVWEADWDGKARHSTFHPCLHPEALVRTEQGYREIRTIAVGDRVYAQDGTFHAVTDVSSHPYQSAELVRIVAKGGNTPTLASDNHPFLVWRPLRHGPAVIGGEVQWVRADELRPGDYTMTPLLAEPESDPFPERDEEYWFLFGLYLAQGHLQRAGHGSNRYPAFSLHKKRQDLAARISEKWKSVSEYDPNDYGGLSQGLTVMAFDAQAGAEFEQLGGRLAHAKRLDPVIYTLPRAKRSAVFQGWLTGDGCQVHDRTYWQGNTVSADLAAGLQLLSESVGYKTNLFSYDAPVELGTIQGRQIKSARPVHYLYFYEKEATVRRGRITHLVHEGQPFSLRYVKSVERVPYQGDVWNLTVDGCPTFQTAVGMSHNTSKPTRLFEIPLEQHTKPGDVCIEPFSGSGSQIIAATKLARRCYAMELTPAFVDGTIDRWQTATGKIATLESTGQTYAEVQEERRGTQAPE